jgi:hypothetical protein
MLFWPQQIHLDLVWLMHHTPASPLSSQLRAAADPAWFVCGINAKQPLGLPCVQPQAFSHLLATK